MSSLFLTKNFDGQHDIPGLNHIPGCRSFNLFPCTSGRHLCSPRVTHDPHARRADISVLK